MKLWTTLETCTECYATTLPDACAASALATSSSRSFRWLPAVGHLWHGYPLLPVDDGERSPPPRRVPREVWARLRGDNVQHAALLTPAEARNLKKGKMA